MRDRKNSFDGRHDTVVDAELQGKISEPKTTEFAAVRPETFEKPSTLKN